MVPVDFYRDQDSENLRNSIRSITSGSHKSLQKYVDNFHHQPIFGYPLISFSPMSKLNRAEESKIQINLGSLAEKDEKLTFI